MAVILTDDIFKSILSSGSDKIPIQISLNFVAKGPVDKTEHWFR